ncbi:MAG: helix-turn-helix domain-containing protein [Pseudomonadota bacterium]
MKLEIVTPERRDGPKRRYDDACAATHGMDIIGERWALPIMRELMLGPRRFGELRKSLPLLSANVLTQRLGDLEAAGIVRKLKLPPPASVQVYGLTEWGQQAGPVFQALGRWAARSPLHDPTRPFSPVSLMLSLRTMIDIEAAGDLVARLGFRFGEEEFHWTIDHGTIALGRGLPADPHIVFAGQPGGVAALVYTGAPIAALEEQGALTVEGDRALAERLRDYFPMPDKAALT